MAKPSAVDQLNPVDKFWLDTRFKDKGYCGYEEIAEILMKRGYSISKSSVHRYGQKLEQKLAAVQASTQAAIMISEAAPDDADQRSAAVMSLIQTELFNSLIALQESNDPDTSAADRIELMAKCGKGIASIMQASIGQKKWMLDVRDRVEKAVQAVDSIAKKGGLSAEAAAAIRKEILGLAK